MILGRFEGACVGRDSGMTLGWFENGFGMIWVWFWVDFGMIWK